MALTLFGLENFPEIEPGDDLAGKILTSLKHLGLALRDRDILVLCQKIVSKAEDRFVDLRRVSPSDVACDLAKFVLKDPAFVQVVLDESASVIRSAPHVLIVRHRLGIVLANAGVDRSNIPEAEHRVLLLPENPDGSADGLRRTLRARTGADIGVVVNDSVGRAWRLGTTGHCIGSAGLEALRDMRGAPDRMGRPLLSTFVATGDEIAAAASLVMGQADEGVPCVLMRGMSAGGRGRASDLLRPAEMDLFL